MKKEALMWIMLCGFTLLKCGFKGYLVLFTMYLVFILNEEDNDK